MPIGARQYTRRAVTTLLGLVLLSYVLGDPYTLHKTASDYVQWAPPWQFAAGVLDLGLLAFINTLPWWRPRLLPAVLAVETLFNIVVTLVLIHRDGIGRFIGGIGAEEFLGGYLVAIALRVALLAWTAGVFRQARAAEA